MDDLSTLDLPEMLPLWAHRLPNECRYDPETEALEFFYLDRWAKGRFLITLDPARVLGAVVYHAGRRGFDIMLASDASSERGKVGASIVRPNDSKVYGASAPCTSTNDGPNLRSLATVALRSYLSAVAPSGGEGR
jgi:hypothetical protein